MPPRGGEPIRAAGAARRRPPEGARAASRRKGLEVRISKGRGGRWKLLASLALLSLFRVSSGVASDATAGGGTGSNTRPALVFRVEGSGNDPEFCRACEVVKALQHLYGSERYGLHQLEVGGDASSSGRRWVPRWLRATGPSERESSSPHPTVVCSVERPRDSGGAMTRGAGDDGAGAGDAAAEGRVEIGGVEELLEFVRGSVLAGPRPLSPAFHEQSLRLKRSHRGVRGLPTPGPGAVGAPPALGEEPEGSPVGDGKDHEYDLVVIGGGSGGLACAKEAARLGCKVACLDFVTPSPHGSTWGLGGTCVNVGCIPKKLMHQAALLGGYGKDAAFFGWGPGAARGAAESQGAEGSGRGAEHSWEEMVRAVQNYIRGLNFKYRTDLRSKGVEYLNALGRLADPHTVIATYKTGKERVLTSSRVVIAVGGRPRGLDCEGGDLAITSDDLFSLKKSPGRTLIVGASYVALECAGFLNGLGLDTSVMVRSVLLRGFDQGMAERIGRFMEAEGTRFLRPAVPHRITRTKAGRLLVSWKDGADGGFREEEFDTVLAATGRAANVGGLGLEAIGLTLSDSGKIVCTNEETAVAGVFAIGDAVEGVPELTPTAIQAGRLLARRLFGGSVEAMDYRNVCTAVFTPLEYACCGMSEDAANVELGEDKVEVYHSAFTPLEWQLNPGRPQNACYVKAVCDASDGLRVVGLHLLGPNAGEVMQGFGLGVRLGMTYDDLRQLVGIHPTVAEELTVLEITKRSGEPIEKSAC